MKLHSTSTYSSLSLYLKQKNQVATGVKHEAAKSFQISSVFIWLEFRQIGTNANERSLESGHSLGVKAHDLETATATDKNV